MLRLLLTTCSLTLASFVFQLPLHAQLQFDWVINQGSNDTELTGSFVLDHLGGIYTTAAFRDTADLNPGPETEMVFVAEDEIFVVFKYTEGGQYLWSGQFSGVGDVGGHIAEIKNNRMLMIVYFTDSLRYTHESSWTLILPGVHVAAISMDLEGQILSHHILATADDLYFADVTTQPDGSILATGSFEGSAILDPQGIPNFVTSNGNDDALIMRMNNQYEIVWLKQIGSTGDDYFEKISVANQSIYYAFVHDSTLVLQTNHGMVTAPANGEDNTIFGRLLMDGSFETAFLFGGLLGDQLRGIAADPAGNMYIAGYFEGDVNFQHPSKPEVIYSAINENDGFVSKYDENGILVWTRIFPNEDYGGVYSLNLHRNAELYISGSYTLKADLDPGPDSIIVNGMYDGDVFAAKFNTDGDMEWVHAFTGRSYEGIRNVVPNTSDKVFIHGYYYDNLDCDPGPDSVEIVTQGGADVFIISLTQENAITATEQSIAFSGNVFPNPAMDVLTITSTSPVEHIQLYALDGSMVNAPVTYENNGAEIKINELTPGMYMAQIKSADAYSTIKFIKQ